MNLPAKLLEWAKQPGTFITDDEKMFIACVHAFKGRVGYGWMQQVIEWIWQEDTMAISSFGPEYFERNIRTLKEASEMSIELLRAEKSAMQSIIQESIETKIQLCVTLGLDTASTWADIKKRSQYVQIELGRARRKLVGR